MKLFVAVDKNWGIGKDGDQPFYIRDDLRNFRRKTLDKVMIMGRVTFMALPGGPLKNRTNIVLTKDAAFAADGVIVCNSLTDLFEHIAKYDTDDLIVIGGQQIYEILLDYCDTAYVTKIFASAETDRHFPNLDKLDNWRLFGQSEMKSQGGLAFCFCEYRKITI